MRVLVIGAKSDIAKAVAREFAKNGQELILAGRKIDELDDFKKDLNIRYSVNVALKEFDITQFDTHQEFIDSVGDFSVVVVAVGVMHNQKVCEKDFKKSLDTINVNFTGIVSILNIIANIFEAKKSGTIIAISSVAGDRGRKANYIYGASKAGLSTYLSGLRNRLFNSNVRVITVKPGFVYTKMTKHLKLPSKLTATPEVVAKDTFNAFLTKKDVIYTKKIWWTIMCIIKHIPEKIFKRMSI